MNLPVSYPRMPARFKFTPVAVLLQGILGTGLTLATGAAMGQDSGVQGGNVLQEVVVTGEAEAIGNLQKTYSGGQLARGGDLGILGRTDVLKVPFSSTNYTSELIEDQQGLTVSDVVMNDASVRTLQARGGYGDDFQVRGFQINNRDVSMNGLFGLTPGTRVPLEMIERVEVLKGPGALTNGVGPNGSVGGSINVVTKRASDTPLTRLTATYMSDAQFGTHLDVGRRFGDDHEWGVRFNGVWRNGEGNIDGGSQRLGLGSLGLDYAGGRLRASTDLLYTEGETTNFRPQASFLAGITKLPKVPDSRKSFYPGADMDDKAKTVIGRVEYDLSDRTTAYASIGYSETTSNQNLPGMSPWPGGIDSNGDFNVTNTYYDEYNRTTSADAGIRTKFNTGEVQHTMVLAVNGMQRETGYFYEATSAVPSNIYDPSPLPVITFARGTPSKSTELDQTSVALADTLGFLSDRVLATLGLRYQTIDQQPYDVSTGAAGVNSRASKVSPLMGLVFAIQKNTSVYYNYTAGLTAGATAPAGYGYANEGQTFAPQKSVQNEIGIKKDWGTLMTQATVYQIEKPTSIVENNVYFYGGEQRHRGLELTAYGEVMRGLRLMTSAAYTEAKLVRTENGTNQGNDASGVPESTYNLGLDWDTPWVTGLSLNGRVIKTSSMYYDDANKLRMPAWTRVDIGARYATEVAGTPVVLRASVENVADEAYWVTASGYVTVGAPRTYMVSATFDF